MGEITPALIRHVAHLARLRLEGAELDRLAGELDEILAYVRQLQAVPTEGVQPTSHVLQLANVLRKDETAPCLPPEVVLALAPATRPPFVAVPKIIEAA